MESTTTSFPDHMGVSQPIQLHQIILQAPYYVLWPNVSAPLFVLHASFVVIIADVIKYILYLVVRGNASECRLLQDPETYSTVGTGHHLYFMFTHSILWLQTPRVWYSGRLVRGSRRRHICGWYFI